MRTFYTFYFETQFLRSTLSNILVVTGGLYYGYWVCLEGTWDQGQENNTSLALVPACIIYTLLVNPLYNLASTRPLEPIQLGAVLGILAVCPGNLAWHVLVLTLHRPGPGQS